MNEETLRQIEQITGYEFSNRDLLHKAFTHSSAVDNRLFSNERLEFLGDSILGMVICQDLFERFPDYLEGDLTQIKSMLVSRRACAKIIKQLSLQKFLRVGKGMNGSRALVGSLAAGAMESLIAAIYIDGGFEAARSFILRMFDSLIEQARKLLSTEAPQWTEMVCEMEEQTKEIFDETIRAGLSSGSYRFRERFAAGVYLTVLLAFGVFCSAVVLVKRAIFGRGPLPWSR